MKEDFQYRENDYFNDVDTFVFQSPLLKENFESKCHREEEKGYWWTNEGMQYKCTSVLSCKKA